MQKLINILAILSFTGTAGIIGGGATLYFNKDAIIDNVKKQVVDAATEGVKDALPGMMGGAVPSTTGLPVAPPTGGSIPSVLPHKLAHDHEHKLAHGYYSFDAMGCMIVRECVDGVEQVWGVDQLKEVYPDSNWEGVSSEFARMLNALTQIGVKVYLADEKYFPVGHRGVYHTVSNNFYLNKTFMHRPSTLMSVMRHEGWHAAQDCMAGSIENSMIAIIMPEDRVPKLWQRIASRTYADMPGSIPWEKEAVWAGKTAHMTQKALESCARGTMWTDYEPTPKTREWLVENGYLKN